MEEKILKEILDVVVDIKTEQKEMKQTMNKMEQRSDGIEQRLDGIEQRLDNVEEEQKEMKQVQNVMCQDIKYLLAEQADTKNIVIELVNKVGEMDLNNKAKIYQFSKR
ncbi:MAG: fungal specific transcription factor domain-containing protein [Clostridia bacterium]|nr:fungal specific transcription factor domain-containing protein [Clostridia bacterium]